MAPLALDLQLAYISLICVNVLILAPLVVRMTLQYYNKRHSYMYSARRPLLVITVNVAVLLYIALYLPTHVIALELIWQNNDTYTEWWDSALNSTVNQILFVTLSLRIWHSFYDFQLGNSISDLGWKAILNEEYTSKQLSCAFRYKRLLGLVSI